MWSKSCCDPSIEGEKAPKRKFKAYPISFFHIEVAKVAAAEGKFYLFVAIGRTHKSAFTQLVE